MNTTDTIAHDSSQTATRSRALPRLGIVLLAAALISATSCGDNTGTRATSTSTTSAVTPTTNSSPVPTTSSPAPTTAAPTTTAPRPTATIDQLVGAEGMRVHVRCVGQGDTTVVLIAGFGGDATNWVNVESAVATQARVCSYDRPGTGTSDAATTTATFTTEATDLHTLLTTIGEPGPYVVVGQSFGGAEAVTFASLFAGELTGLVLIDASPTTWPSTLCAVADDGSDAAAMVRATCTSAFLPTGNSEHLDIAAAFAEVSSIPSLGSLPMAIVTATERELPAGLAVSEVARLTEAWNQGQQDWMALSPAAHLVSVDHTGHHIEIDQPKVVIDQITHLLP